MLQWRIMAGKSQPVRLFQVMLGLMLLIGLFPRVSAISAKTGHVATAPQTGAFYNQAWGETSAPTPGCNNSVGLPDVTCGLLTPPFACSTHLAGIQCAVFSPLSAPTTYREIVTPPPKI